MKLWHRQEKNAKAISQGDERGKFVGHREHKTGRIAQVPAMKLVLKVFFTGSNRLPGVSHMGEHFLGGFDNPDGVAL
jgi:hypothetical protein